MRPSVLPRDAAKCSGPAPPHRNTHTLLCQLVVRVIVADPVVRGHEFARLAAGPGEHCPSHVVHLHQQLEHCSVVSPIFLECHVGPSGALFLAKKLLRRKDAVPGGEHDRREQRVHATHVTRVHAAAGATGCLVRLPSESDSPETRAQQIRHDDDRTQPAAASWLLGTARAGICVGEPPE